MSGTFKDNYSEIGLCHLDDVKEDHKADWRLLQSSWAFADAVLISGQILRTEVNADCSLKYDDLIEYRKTVLKKDNDHPIQCVLSETGDFPLDRPVFHNNKLKVWILTLESSAVKLQARINEEIKNYCEWSDITIHGIDSNIVNILNFLKGNGINFLDISTGGRVIRTLIDKELLDELRMTTVGHIVGPLNSSGLRRPNLHPFDIAKSYSPSNSPLVKWIGIRTIGDYFLFYRGIFEYRK
jgi:riboflavin biosynthesis pyrimidine reductase